LPCKNGLVLWILKGNHLYMEIVGINKNVDGFLKKAVKYGRSKLDCILELL